MVSRRERVMGDGLVVIDKVSGLKIPRGRGPRNCLQQHRNATTTMVEITSAEEDLLPSQERLLDAEEIEKAADALKRDTARLHLTALAKKLRREAEALARLEKSRHLEAHSPTKSPATDTTPTPLATAATPVTPSSSTVHYTPVDRFAFDAGGYDSAFVTLYVPLEGVGAMDRSRIQCQFTEHSLDLVIDGLLGKSYRLYRDNLAHDIDPDKSKIIVKADKIVVKLAKIKTEYGGYDYWSELTEKKKKTKSSDNPQASIMQLMKDMYDSGDDNMRKVIGETMLKQQRGELGNDMDLGMGI